MTRKRTLGDIGKQRRIKVRRNALLELAADTVEMCQTVNGKQNLECYMEYNDDEAIKTISESNREVEFKHANLINSLNTSNESLSKPDKCLVNKHDMCPYAGTARQVSRSPEVNNQLQGTPAGDATANKELQQWDSGYTSGSEDESDVLNAIAVDCRSEPKSPESVDGNCTWSRHSDSSPIENEMFRFGKPPLSRSANISDRKALLRAHSKPDETSDIYIQHEYATDSPKLGDLFGVTLETYQWKKDKKTYFQHFLTNVKADGPACAMKIENWDELVLLNDVFVPNFNHMEVLRLFSTIKVDSHTKIILVIRRLSPEKLYREWLWYQTSAILIPELPRPPKVKELHYESVPGGYDQRVWTRMHVWNDALYLTVTQNDVSVEKLLSGDDDDPVDKSRKICVWSKVQEDPNTGLLNRYVMSLFGYHSPPDPEPYVAIDILGDAVVSKGRAFWYDFSKIGSEYYIKIDGKYLGYDGTSNKVGLHKERQYFELRGTDKPNTSSHNMARDSTDGSDLSNTSGSTHMSQDSLQDLSSQDSMTSSLESVNMYGDSPHGLSYPEFPSAIISSGSQDDSNSSGYITSSPPDSIRVTRSMSRQHTVTSPMMNLSLD